MRTHTQKEEKIRVQFDLLRRPLFRKKKKPGIRSSTLSPGKEIRRHKGCQGAPLLAVKEEIQNLLLRRINYALPRLSFSFLCFCKHTTKEIGSEESMGKKDAPTFKTTKQIKVETHSNKLLR